jgi:hypothetical protein
MQNASLRLGLAASLRRVWRWRTAGAIFPFPPKVYIGVSMPIDAEIEAAVVAMRAVRVKGAKVHEEVLWAYTRAAVEAAERARQKIFKGVPG